MLTTLSTTLNPSFTPHQLPPIFFFHWCSLPIFLQETPQALIVRPVLTESFFSLFCATQSLLEQSLLHASVFAAAHRPTLGQPHGHLVCSSSASPFSWRLSDTLVVGVLGEASKGWHRSLHHRFTATYGKCLFYPKDCYIMGSL